MTAANTHRLGGVLVVVAVLAPLPAHAQWTDMPVCTAAGNQQYAAMTSDGAGGAVIVWQDTRANPGSSVADIYVQRVTATGGVLWTPNGFPICTAANFQSEPHVVSDGAGGWIVLWGDCRAGCSSKRIYAQRLNANGMPQWTADGIVASSGASSSPGNIDAVSDGAGGAIIVWADWGNSTPGIYAQRLFVNGTRWAADVTVCALTHAETQPKVTADGGGGWVVTWKDDRVPLQDDVYAQRLNGAGVPQWAANGVPVTTSHVARHPQIVPSVLGETVIEWADARFGNGRPFGQRLNSSGVNQWAAGGVQLSEIDASSQSGPFASVVSDGAGGAILGWSDQSLGAHYILAQRVSSSGALQWSNLGVLVWPIVDPDDQWPAYPASLGKVVSDGSGGAILMTVDARSDVTTPPDTLNAYAQRLNGAGALQWPPNGVPASWVSASKFIDNAIPDGSGGVLFTMDVSVPGGSYDLYAGRLVNGRVDVGAVTPDNGLPIRIEGIRPNPASAELLVTFFLPSAEAARVELLDLSGRRVLTRPLSLSNRGLFTIGLPEVAFLAPGIYFLRLLQVGRVATQKVVVSR